MSLANKPKKILKMYLYLYKIGHINLPSITKVMENHEELQLRLSGNYDLCLQTY